MFGEEVDVVGDDHQVSDTERGVYSSGGIGDEQLLDADFMEHPYREGDFLHGIAFVIVEAPLHGDDVFVAEFAEQQVAFVALYRGYGEIRNGGIRDDVFTAMDSPSSPKPVPSMMPVAYFSPSRKREMYFALFLIFSYIFRYFV